MKLPNPEMTLIDDGKLIAYSLNFNHDEGKHKARVFKSALGITLDNLEELKIVLLEAVKNYEAILTKANSYGQKYIIDFPLTRNNQTAIIQSVWIIRNEENFPRLVTCYVL
ncbi:MAG: hypothetical protein IGQ45_10485 [Cyanobacterium sp. T60_A2020_053]|nr:hypothetical protein [Cyanobacterium sp. T60_A2020_053]